MLSGDYYEGNLFYGSAGYWWSASAVDGRSQYTPQYMDNNFYTSTPNNKHYGFPVRCIRSS